MNISPWVWAATVGGLLLLIALDFYLVARNPRDPSARESTIWVSCYVALAVAFGLGLWGVAGAQYGGEFFAGWITEYSLSVDNLFVFILIMSTFAVPRQNRQKVLLIGIVLALILRGAFIAVGAEAISRFDWMFYVFGAFLIYTAWKLLRQNAGDEEEFNENRALRLVRRVVPSTPEFHGAKLAVRLDGRRVFTPMLIVMVAIGTTDLLFALDSIPAIFGLTQEPYLVFTANAFALMGLRQLFFLIGGLLERLVYLSKGLSLVLGFIGIKLILEAMHHHGVSWAPEIPILVSLGVILGTLLITTVASLLKSRGTARREAEDASPSPALAEAQPASGESKG
ncbi:MAG TPA: TerC family protein [Pseudonocardia sp.]|jgi:tellurite resistance protein TerC|uniref:TerC family protein n=1 Tax=Pseudonocardia sp. TaxID=60912 RepID=UPI002C857BEC|nr:TerC family protein [Pseudonocardia sp.]HTF51450.1 TerC family protein [Pseudonocardia sp.]